MTGATDNETHPSAWASEIQKPFKHNEMLDVNNVNLILSKERRWKNDRKEKLSKTKTFFFLKAACWTSSFAMFEKYTHFRFPHSHIQSTEMFSEG